MNKRFITKDNNKTLYLISFFVFILFSVLNLSCSQNLPELKSVNSAAIFDFATENSKPVVRYSFYVESTSDARRAEQIEVQSKKNGYIWKCDDLVKIANSKRQWAGYSNFVVPEGVTPPDGTFLIKYISADGEEAETSTFLSYDVKFVNITAAEVPEFAKEKNGRNNIAVFNRDNKILYYGEKTKDFKDEASILRKYREAYYYRDIWITGSNSVMCLLPKTLLRK